MPPFSCRHAYATTLLRWHDNRLPKYAFAPRLIIGVFDISPSKEPSAARDAASRKPLRREQVAFSAAERDPHLGLLWLLNAEHRSLRRAAALRIIAGALNLAAEVNVSGSHDDVAHNQ